MPRHGNSLRAPPETRCICCELWFCCETGLGWEHAGVLLTLIYRLIRSLLDFVAVIARSNRSKDVELLVLRQENQVLRRQGRPLWDDADPALARRVVPAGPSPSLG
jgi:hypothetical protein